MQVLMMTVHSQDRPFGNEQLQAIADATRDQRNEWRRVALLGPDAGGRVTVAGASGDIKRYSASSLAGRTVAVVWMHTWPDCPVAVIELSKIVFPNDG